jgi:hypothetical protein
VLCPTSRIEDVPQPGRDGVKDRAAAARVFTAQMSHQEQLATCRIRRIAQPGQFRREPPRVLLQRPGHQGREGSSMITPLLALGEGSVDQQRRIMPTFRPTYAADHQRLHWPSRHNRQVGIMHPSAMPARPTVSRTSYICVPEIEMVTDLRPRYSIGHDSGCRGFYGPNSNGPRGA